jgi:hypothetical protein
MLFSGDNSATMTHAGKFREHRPLQRSPSGSSRPRNRTAPSSSTLRSPGPIPAAAATNCVLDEGRPFFALIHFWPGNAVAVRARDPLPLDQWSHLTITYDGSSLADGIRLFHNGEPLPVEMVRDHLYKDIQHRRNGATPMAAGLRSPWPAASETTVSRMA